MKTLIHKIRPNILALEFGLLTLAIVSIVLLDTLELAGVCVGGMIAFGNQILEKED